MKNVWKRRIPALFLALVMTVGLTPAALAVEEWKHDETHHWHEAAGGAQNDRAEHDFGNATYTETPATCHTTGTGYQECTVCHYKKPVVLPADPSLHVKGTGYQSDGTKHWIPCANSGCTYHFDEAGHTAAASNQYTAVAGGSTHWQVCKTCGAQFNEESHTANQSGVCTKCGQAVAGYQPPVANNVTVKFYNGSSLLSSTGVVKGNKPAAPAKPTKTGTNCTYTFKGWTTANPGSNAYTASTALVDAGNVAVNADTTYYAVYSVAVKSQSGSVTAATAIGSSLWNHIKSKCSSFGFAPASVRFTALGSSSYGTLYTDSRQRTSVSRNTDYDSAGVSSMTFKPGGSSGTYTLSYAAKDANNTLEGTISVSNSASGTTITIDAAPGRSEKFDADEFLQAYQDRFNGKPTTVEFDVDRDDYNDFRGSVYSGSEELSWRDFTDGDGFACSGSGSGSLSGLSFRPDANARDGSELEVDYTVYSGSRTVEGTLILRVSGSVGDIVYKVAPGRSVTFTAKDFNEAYQAMSDTSRTIRYVAFSAPSDYNSFKGELACGSDTFSRSDLTYSKTRFYYSSSSYGDYDLGKVTFQAERTARDGDTLTFDYRAYYRDDDYETGTVEIRIDGESADGDITYEVSPGRTVDFRARDFRDFLRKTYKNDDVDYVVFDEPSSSAFSQGTLYCDYGKSGEKKLSRSDLDGGEFYYTSSSRYYGLDDLTFKADSDFKTAVKLTFTVYGDGSHAVEGTLTIRTGDGDTEGDITYEVSPGRTVAFQARDFRDFLRKTYRNADLDYVIFDEPSSSAFSQGTLYCDYGKSGEKKLSRSDLDGGEFYYTSSSRYYGLDDLTFAADSDFKTSVVLEFTAYSDDDDYVEGTLVICSTDKSKDGDITYKVAPGKSVELKRTAFNTFFRNEYKATVSYVVFDRPAATVFNYGTLYAGYGSKDQTAFTARTLSDTRFYYDKADAGRNDYYLDDLTFVADSRFSTAVELTFTAYGDDDEYVEGTLVIKPDTVVSSNYLGSIRYAGTAGGTVRISADDVARFYRRSYPGQKLLYVTLGGVPSAGTLYYNYQGNSRYGTSSRTAVNASNYKTFSFYAAPTGTQQYALTELTYVPTGSNYCVTIPFTAYGTSASVSGSILISITAAAISDVYGITPVGKAVNFPAASIAAAVKTGTGQTLSAIQLLTLPAASVGTVYVGAGSTQANTSTAYSYSGGAYQIDQLRFVPASGYNGSVEIPYVALDSTGTAIGSGLFALGVLKSQRTFKDVGTSVWCWKYVTELTDLGVISGYSDGSFKPDDKLSYGAALKLILLAAGYPEQSPVAGGGTFSGYLAKARAEGIITRSNVDLAAPITRLQVAQLAAGALKLDTENVPGVNPFKDTEDGSVLALNAAGIVGGYGDTYRPANGLTRGQISAIVWRMEQYRK